MSPRKVLFPLVAGLALALFLFALFELLLLRYEHGDIYPESSTLRADPLGCEVLYEALGSLPGYTAERGLTVLHRELALKPRTLFFLGLDEYAMEKFSREEVEALDHYVRDGGRVVLAFSPTSGEESFSRELREAGEKGKKEKHDAKDKKESPPAKEKPQDKPEPGRTEQEKYEREDYKSQKEDDKDNVLPDYRPSAAAMWGFGLERHEETTTKKQPAKDDSSDDEDKPEVFAVATPGAGIEPEVPWQSSSCLVRLEPEFQVLYRAKGKPVMARRSWGKGEVIVATDTYFVSNEALRDDRKPALLALVAGPPGLLVFDETHLGTEVSEGVMALVRRFRLEGYLIGAIAVLLLFLWRNSVPLVPPVEARADLGGAVSGKDSRTGLVNLLRRNIPARDILRASFNEWKRGITPARPHLHAKMQEIESVLSALPHGETKNLVPAYHQVREINQPSPGAKIYGTKPGTAHPPSAVRTD